MSRGLEQHNQFLIVYLIPNFFFISFFHQDFDGLLHLQWKDRISNVMEDDITILPGDAIFERVQQAKDGRVYALRFHESKRKHFFWMQEPSADQDEEYCQVINNAIEEGASYDTVDEEESMETSPSSSRIQAPSVPMAYPTPSIAHSPSPQVGNPAFTGQLTRESLASLFASIQVPNQQDHGPTLQALLDPDALQQLFDDPDFFSDLQRLQEHLPEGTQTHEIPELVRCVPFRQFLAKLNYAIKKGYGAEIFAPFGIVLPPNEAPGLEALLRAIAAMRR
eukprot:TRINITY_DN3571_c0_g1_i2.p1 TRINITY_DN3571_c0_g1~~TRINITY_DN3571_c0_g1_i2.p1  ORF type:complete len:279 (+),score=50.37 TRINITY_DN3571_c0_g1_i2:549-1385(+)